MPKLKLAKKYEKYPEYKDSGVEWLENIPKEWKIVCAKRLFSEIIKKGEVELSLASVTQEQGVVLRSESGLSVWNPESDISGYKTVNVSDFVISLRSFEGGIEFSHVKGLVSPAYTVIRLRKKLNNQYYKWLFKSKAFISALQINVRGIRDGKNISYQDFSRIDLPVIINLNEQDKIARVLDKKTLLIDQIIEKKQKLIELLREKIYSITLEFSINSRKSKGLWEVSDNKWCFRKAKWIFEEINIRNRIDEEQLAVTQDNGVIPKRLCQENFTSASTNENLKLVNKNDFVISLRSFQGGIELSGYVGLVSPAYTVIRLKKEYDNTFFRTYYRYLLKSPQFIMILNTVISGIRDGKNISFVDFKKILLPIPRADSLKQLELLAKKIELLLSYIKKEEKSLQEYKFSLISNAVTGKIKIY